jgi:antiviral helicase SKI2
VLENVLADYTAEEIVALLSAFVFQEKTDVEPTLTAALTRGVAAIVKISEKVNEIQTLHQVILSSDDSNDFVSKPRFGMVEVVYEWARGMSFNRITDLTDVMEGTIVRVITRLDETCREVKNAARIIGDPVLFQKMGTCQELIKRYVRFCATGIAGHYRGWDYADNFFQQGHMQLRKLVPVKAGLACFVSLWGTWICW